jgi:hypothetical protein
MASVSTMPHSITLLEVAPQWLTYAFSKEWDNLKAVLALDHVWALDELIGD